MNHCCGECSIVKYTINMHKNGLLKFEKGLLLREIQQK